MQGRTDVDIHPPDDDCDSTNGHQIALAGVAEVTVTVVSADGTPERAYHVTFEPMVVELALGLAWTSFKWPGADGVAMAEAGLPGEVVAVYTWDETRRPWLGYFPGLEGVPDLNTLSAFSSGTTYWIAAAEDVTWVVPAPAGGEN